MDPNLAFSTAPELLVIECVVVLVAVYVFMTQLLFYNRENGYQNGQRQSRDFLEVALISISAFFIFLTVVFQIMRIDSILKYFTYPIITAAIFIYINYFLYVVSLMLFYIVSWLRQRAILLDPALLDLSNRPLSIAIRYFIIYMVVVGLVLLPAAITFNLLSFCVKLCYTYTLLVSLTIAPLSVQLPLLSMILYPLFKHHVRNVSTNQKYVLTLIERMAVLAAISLMSDVTSAIMHVYSETLFAPLQVNLIVNLTCITMTPFNWRNRLCVNSGFGTIISSPEDISDLNANVEESTDHRRYDVFES